MLLKRVTFNNFRLYKGFNNIDLSVDESSRKNIILIGAQNGSGKTSILEGILLALYGRQSNLTTSETYEQMLRESFNTESYRQGFRNFYVEVEFVSNEQHESNLIVKREWRVGDSEINEILTIKENNQELKHLEDELEKTQFIQNIIPFGVSKFFFFDAEKIQYMADDNIYEESLTSSIRDILNINVYQTLVNDLVTYEKNLKRSQADVKESDIYRLEADIRELSENKIVLYSDLSEAKQELRKMEIKIQEIKKWLREQGIGSLAKRSDTQAEIDALKTKRDDLRDKFISFLEEELAFIITFPIIEEINKQIKKEEKYSETKMRSRQNHENLHKLLNVLNTREVSPDLIESQKNILARELQVVWAQITEPIFQDNMDLLHDLSQSELTQLKEELDTLVNRFSKGNSDLGNVLLQYEDTTYEIDQKIQLLKQLPSNEKVEKKEAELETLENEKKTNEELIRKLMLSIEENEEKARILSVKLDELIDKVKVTKDIQIKIDESKLVRRGLEEFIEKLTIEKAGDVEHYLTEMFNRLARKDNLVKKFIISPQTFEVYFENSYGEVLPKRRLSAGEKEIFSISLVWALAKASQKPLPIVIDTPLGRLDKVHKRNLLLHYFPHASRQVIILSTDEEVADEWKDIVDPYVFKEYLITDMGEFSSIQNGYFEKLGVFSDVWE